MFVFLSFGSALESKFKELFDGKWLLYFLVLYFGGLVFSNLYALVKHKDNFNYNAVGASGAVSAVTFACVLLSPMSEILFFLVIPMPAIVFALLYLGYSYYMGKKAVDNVAHDAHFIGAVFGFVFPLIIEPSLIKVFWIKIFG